MNTHIPKNYNTDGGDKTVIGGTLEFKEGAQLKGFPGAENIAPKSTSTGEDIRADLNDLIAKLKDAGIVTPDAWNLSVLACPTPASMPTENTAANSAHATVSIEGTEITVALNCKVSDLADANHGEDWGTHKWLGFGIRTGLGSVVGVKFTDDTGASATLTSADAEEATALGLSAGDFVLYIKADQPEYLTGKKSITLWASTYAETTFTIRITETKA